MKLTAYDCSSKKLLTVSENFFIETAFHLMDNYDLQMIPVVNDQDCIVGVISKNKIQTVIQSRELFMQAYKTETTEFDPQEKVKDYMSRPKYTIPKKMPLKEVVIKMLDQRVNHFMIQDYDQIVGIITSEDCLRVLLRYIQKEESEELSLQELMMNPILMGSITTLGNAGI